MRKQNWKSLSKAERRKLRKERRNRLKARRIAKKEKLIEQEE